MPRTGPRLSDTPVLDPGSHASYPFIIEHEGKYLAYATNTGNANVQMATSTDLTRWQLLWNETDPSKLYDAMPVLPSWADAGATWAAVISMTARSG